MREYKLSDPSARQINISWTNHLIAGNLQRFGRTNSNALYRELTEIDFSCKDYNEKQIMVQMFAILEGEFLSLLTLDDTHSPQYD